MNIDQAQILAKKILAGEASPEEKTALRNFMNDHEHLPRLADQLFPLQEFESISEDVLPAGIEARVLRPIIGTAPALVPQRSTTLRRLLRISVAAAVLVAVSLVAYQYFQSSSSQQAADIQLSTISTEPGRSKEVVLTDGTHIRLNGGTVLRFPASFSGASREVYLDGEAFFDVSKDSTHPFIIHSPAFTTTVLGTSFNVRSSSQQQQLSEVAVATGKVRVAISGEKVSAPLALLIPGEKASYRAGDNRGLIKKQIDISSVGGWRVLRFYYEQAPLAVILNDLERAYGLHFSIKDPAILNCTFSVTFKHMKMEEILQTLSLMGEVKFTKDAASIQVTGNPCK